ncbi:MAG: diacylglycerol kinase [Rhodospirillales bacterium]|jgi:diacylglycerol kinase family enzyme|nr:diacylglycerol kinase [Rhodospirillales bacterium]MDB5381753.1 diacylglycerol kinase [Rhodospirillales bacterium]
MLAEANEPVRTGAALIVNAQAGSLSGLATPRAELEVVLRAQGFHFPVAAAEHMPLIEQWAMFDHPEVGIVFVAGGDGTLRAAAEKAMKTGRILAPLPGGTMNRFCQRFALPNDPIEAARCYRPGPARHTDVATVNGDVFLYQSIVGRPTRLMRFREMQRGSGMRGWWPLLVALLRSLFRPHAHDVLVRFGRGKRRSGHAAVITLAQGGLELSLARPTSAYARVRQAWRWVRGRLSDDPETLDRAAQHLVVHGGAALLRLSLDGEMRLAPSPLRFRMHRGALAVLLPPAS